MSARYDHSTCDEEHIVLGTAISAEEAVLPTRFASVSVFFITADLSEGDRGKNISILTSIV